MVQVKLPPFFIQMVGKQKIYFLNGINSSLRHFRHISIIVAAAAGFENCFITLRISSNCLISWLLLLPCCPEPLAIRNGGFGECCLGFLFQRRHRLDNGFDRL